MRLDPDPSIIRGLRVVGPLLAALGALFLGMPATAATRFSLTGEMIARQGKTVYTHTNAAPVLVEPVKALGYHDRLQTLELSRATVRFMDLSEFQMSELTEIEIVPHSGGLTPSSVRQHKGRVNYSNWDKPSKLMVQTPHASAWATGTEFVVNVLEDRTEVSMFDGEVEVRNEAGTTNITSGFEAIAVPGEPLRVRPLLRARNVIQWWLYYPGVLDAAELDLRDAERARLSASLEAYRAGDLLQALERHPAYPRGTVTGSAGSRVYYAALLLSVGQVEATGTLLRELPRDAPLAQALRTLIAAVRLDDKGFVDPELAARPSASLWLASSYWHQSRHDLPAARAAAQRAVELAPGFGFAWERLAELEFGFGRTPQAADALAQALELSPRNAQAHALQGFVLSAQGKLREALAAFEQALQLDNGLGNAWLGRGLGKFRRNDRAGGLADLRTAAVLEPNRSLLRSYLGKAFAELGDDLLALDELEYAVLLDPEDPTPWMYRALLRSQENRPNPALRDLQESLRLNENRRLFRSRMLLDQDRAVRGANLARIYRDLGLEQLSLTEASRAVAADYTDVSTHRFLADTYDGVRDVRQVNLRYESAWLNEWLLANLLGPVGSGSVSLNVSQQEYARMFESGQPGVFAHTDLRTNGEWRQTASQYGTFGRASYAVDFFYYSQEGTGLNDDLEQGTLSVQAKLQITERDSLFLQVYGYDLESGDVRQYYDPADAQADLRFTEQQRPTAFLGYHREWSPGQHTLFLAGWLDSETTYRHAEIQVPTLRWNPDGTTTSALLNYEVPDYTSDLDAVSGELQHIWQTHPHTFIVGACVQAGTTDSQGTFARHPLSFPPGILTNGVVQSVEAELNRVSAYGYYHFQVLEPLLLIAGVSYDRLAYPQNIDQPPITAGENSADQVSPKAGLVWSPVAGTVVRGTYSQSLGGVYYDSSVRLEPSQLAGFVQTFRSAIPESVVGAVPGTGFETAGAAIDQQFGDSTFVSLQGNWLSSQGVQEIGMVEVFSAGNQSTQLSTTPRTLDFEEGALTVSAHQLVGELWGAGVTYRVSRAWLDSDLPNIPPSPFLDPSQEQESTLQQVGLSLRFNHPSGLFGLAQSVWNHQSWNSAGTGGNVAGNDQFWQHNVYLGYRFAQRRAEIRLGVLNLGNADYQLNPLNLYPNYPRSRTVAVSAKFDF